MNQKLKSLIARSNIEECIDLMMNDMQGKYEMNTVAMVSAKFYKLQQDRKANLLSYADVDLANNRIAHSLISLIDDFYPEEEEEMEGLTNIEYMVAKANDLEEKTMFYDKTIKDLVQTVKKELVDYQFEKNMDADHDHQDDQLHKLTEQLSAIQNSVAEYERRLENDLKLEIRQKVKSLQEDLNKGSLLETATALAALDNNFATFVDRANRVNGQLLMINLAKDMHKAAMNL